MSESELHIACEGALLAGVDEAGRGPLAGPVVAAAVILDPDRPIAGITDSKKLSEARRETLALAIQEQALAWSIGRASVEEIDSLNILHATMLAMRRALEGMSPLAEHALIDGNRCPDALPCTAQAIVKGDQRVTAIAAASIIAKVSRDHEMLRLHEQFPQYGFDKHKGYGTRDHLEALREHGALAEHRRSFSPVRRVLEGAG
ncbi:MAG: ribonuclease HII [Granulosicoccaceae bacterium]|jgi:ribonuclease HII